MEKPVLITQVTGVGPGLAKQFYEQGIKTVNDLLLTWPSRHDFFHLISINQAMHKEKVTLRGRVMSDAIIQPTRNKSYIKCNVLFDKITMEVIVFNREFLKPRLITGTDVTIRGIFDARQKTIVAESVHFDLTEDTITPIYNLGEMSQFYIRRAILNAYNQYHHLVFETLPPTLCEKYVLPSIKTLMQLLHFPKKEADLEQAKRRLKYEELLIHQTRFQYIRRLERQAIKPPKRYDLDKVKTFIASLPFELTEDQKQTVNDVFRDLKSPYPANRLIQGDVGSGKTIVAALAIYATITTGMQATIMAPTEVLAHQHLTTFRTFFEDFPDVKIAYLSSNVKTSEKKLQKEAIATGKVNLVIGTHALIQSDVTFKALGLVITDEQHRFGVKQRQALREKGQQPDVLSLTATPIPRTFAIGMFGDLDVSSIRTLPMGRKPVKTTYLNEQNIEKAYQNMEKDLAHGRQAFVIVPLIEASEALDARHIEEVHRMLQKRFPQHVIDIIHGRFQGIEKHETMARFQEGKSNILLSTTVVEVGVDIANASIIVIFDAHRFGLSQLHQLRGRIGRGEHPSHCFLVSPNEDVERLKIMETTHNGFALSEADLKMRGPGDFFGSRQTGLPKFKHADLFNDLNILLTAQKDATQIINNPSFLPRPEQQMMMQHLQRWSKSNPSLD